MIIIKIFKVIISGFYFLCSLLSKGFYFYSKQLFIVLKKIFKTNKLDPVIKHYEKRQKQPEFCLLLILYFIAIITLVKIFYVKPQEVVRNNIDMDIIDNVEVNEQEKDNDSVTQEDDSSMEDSDLSNDSNSNDNSIISDTNPFRNFAKTSLSVVNINELKKSNSDTIAWISVDGTNINYPVVQTKDNDYYLYHSFDKTYKKTGWIFMDYRNSSDMSNHNTIFYGHNLLNKTAFGSISNIFTDDWASSSNHTIVILTEDMQYVYKIFSAYYIEPEIYYLQNVFYSNSEYQAFLDTIKSRNIINVDNSVDVNDKIITLSTCTDDNQGRKVVHAKLISSSKRS